jgi:hypothetical protein
MEAGGDNMDWLEFTASVVGSLAWPLAAVALGFMFREQVRKLLDKMKSLKAPGGIEASFSEEVKKVAAETEQVQVVSITQADQDHISAANMNRLIGERPSAIILDAWRNIEKAMLDVIAERGVYIGEKNTQSPGRWIHELERQSAVSQEAADVLRELYALRNKVAHMRDFEPERADAIRYLESADKVIRHLTAPFQRKLQP